MEGSLLVEVTSSHIMRREYLSIIHASAWKYMDLDNKYKLCLHNGVKLSNNEQQEECIGGCYCQSRCKEDLRRSDHCTVSYRTLTIRSSLYKFFSPINTSMYTETKRLQLVVAIHVPQIVWSLQERFSTNVAIN